MKKLLGEILFDLGVVIAPYIIIVGIGIYNVNHPAYPYSGYIMHPYKTEEERNKTKQIEYIDVIKRQYEESHTYCHYCKEYFHKDDLHEVFIFLACENCYKEASQIDYSQFCE